MLNFLSLAILCAFHTTNRLEFFTTNSDYEIARREMSARLAGKLTWAQKKEVINFVSIVVFWCWRVREAKHGGAQSRPHDRQLPDGRAALWIVISNGFSFSLMPAVITPTTEKKT